MFKKIHGSVKNCLVCRAGRAGSLHEQEYTGCNGGQ